jgi:hypothetical protein
MSRVLDAVGPAPETRDPRFAWLLFGASAAPLAWLGQMMLSYSITAYVCYPGDHPVPLSSRTVLFTVLVTSDLVALVICAASGWVSCSAWVRVVSGKGRNRFLALWGMMSSLWFCAAVLFNVIASLMVPLCLS